MPDIIWQASTNAFFVKYISRSGLHRNFSVYGSMRSDVQKVICASSTPRSANMITEARERATKGSPMAK